MPHSITVIIYGNRGEHTVKFPARWVICPQCDGHATDRGASVECDGGGFTANEWAEQDEEFREDYLAGRYDRSCDHCAGLGRVQDIDREQVTDVRLKRLLVQYDCQQRDFDEIDAIQAAERRMGV